MRAILSGDFIKTRTKGPFGDFNKLFAIRKQEADDFYSTVIPQDISDDAQNVMGQGFAGILWSKQFYDYVLKDWLEGVIWRDEMNDQVVLVTGANGDLGNKQRKRFNAVDSPRSDSSDRGTAELKSIILRTRSEGRDSRLAE